MANITCAWELGGGLGHVANLSVLDQLLRRRGHKISYILKNPGAIQHFVAKDHAEILQAPRWNGQVNNLPQPIANFTEILMRRGYLSRKVLLELCQRWRHLLQKTEADLLIADYSPTAILAAYTLGIKCVSICNGFSTPPSVSPFPVFRDKSRIDKKRIIDGEQKVLMVVNSVLEKYNSLALNALKDIYERLDFAFITTFPEMDPYHPRIGGNYVGHIMRQSQGSSRSSPWPKGEQPRIIVYLKPDYQRFEQSLSQIADIDAFKLIYAGEVPPKIHDRYQSKNMVFSSTPLNLNKLLPECDAVVCNAGHGLVLECLLAGKPLVMLPMVYEHGLTAWRVESMRTGLIANPSDKNRDCAFTLRRVLDDGKFRSNAQNFANKYQAFNGQEMLNDIVDKCEQLIDN